MSTLQERLDRIRIAFLQQAPDDVKVIMQRTTDDLRTSKTRSQIPKPGAPLPAFELPDTEGKLVRSADLLRQGPLVLSVYRGLW